MGVNIKIPHTAASTLTNLELLRTLRHNGEVARAYNAVQRGQATWLQHLLIELAQRFELLSR